MQKIKTCIILLILFVFAGVSFSQSQQENLNEVRLNYGFVSVEQFSFLISTVLIGTTFGGLFNENVKDIDGSFTGPIMLQYQKSFKNNNFTVGGLFGYSQARTDVIYESKPGISFSVDITYITLMAQSEYKYINNKNFQLYSGLGLGADILLPTGNDTKGESAPTKIGPAFQVTPLGLKAGSDKFGGLLEIGFGSKGLITAGVYSRF